jgi:hypothetical protein
VTFVPSAEESGGEGSRGGGCNTGGSPGDALAWTVLLLLTCTRRSWTSCTRSSRRPSPRWA